MLIEKDLGLTGNNRKNLILAIQKEFGINFCDETRSMGNTSELKEDVFLFHQEDAKLPPSKKEKATSLTIGQLYDATTKLLNK